MNSEVKNRLISHLEKAFDARTAAANISDSATVEIVLTKAHDEREKFFTRRYDMQKELAGIKSNLDQKLYVELCDMVFNSCNSAIRVISIAEKEAIEAAAVNQLCGLPF